MAAKLGYGELSLVSDLYWHMEFACKAVTQPYAREDSVFGREREDWAYVDAGFVGDEEIVDECPVDFRHNRGSRLKRVSSIDCLFDRVGPILAYSEFTVFSTEFLGSLKRVGFKMGDWIEANLVLRNGEEVDWRLSVFAEPELRCMVEQRIIPESANRCPYCGVAPLNCPGCGRLRIDNCRECGKKISRWEHQQGDDGRQIVIERRIYEGRDLFLQGKKVPTQDFFATRNGYFASDRLLRHFRKVGAGPYCGTPAEVDITGMTDAEVDDLKKRATERPKIGKPNL